MSVIVVASAAAAVTTTVATVVVAALPEAHALLAPLTEHGNEYAVTAISILASIPMLGIMAVMATSTRE